MCLYSAFCWDSAHFLPSSYGTVLCLRFRMRISLITHWCLSCCWALLHIKSWTLQLLDPCQQEGWRGTSSWEGTKPGQLTPTEQRDTPYHTASQSKINWRESWQEATALELTGTGRQVVSNCFSFASLVFLGVYFSLFVTFINIVVIFPLLNCLYHNLLVFLLLFSQFYPLLPRGEWVSGCVVLSCQLGLNHDFHPF